MGNQEILLSTIFNESFDAMMILDLSTQKFIMFNKKTLEIYNYSEEELTRIFFEYGEERFSRKIAKFLNPDGVSFISLPLFLVIR